MKIACIDLGGTNIKYGVLENGVLLQAAEAPTCAEKGAEDVMRRIAQLVRAMPGVERVGISTAGEVEPGTGRIRLSSNIPGYTGMNPRILLQEALGMPVAVENDVNAAAAGEYAFGAARQVENFLMVSYGTGVGGAAYVGGQLYRGVGGSAGEFGGLVTHPEAVRLDDQGSGSYERYASTTALVARVAKRCPSVDSGRAIFAHLDDLAVREELEAWVLEVACGLVSLMHAFDPQRVVLGGGILQEPWLQEALGKAVYPMLKPSFRTCELAPAALGNRAGLMGAGYLAAGLDGAR